MLPIERQGGVQIGRVAVIAGLPGQRGDLAAEVHVPFQAVVAQDEELPTLVDGHPKSHVD